MAHYMTEAEKASIINDYKNGDQTATLAERYKRDRGSIILLLQRAGVHEPDRARRNERLTDEVVQRVAQLYASGQSIDAVAAACDIATTTARRALARAGVASRSIGRRSAWPEEARQKALEMFKAGASQAQVARHFNVSDSCVFNMLKRAGVSGASERRAEAAAGETAVCRTCMKEKHKSEFAVDRKALSGVFKTCKECERWRTREAKYGITREQYEALHKAQNGKCASCGCIWAGTEKHPDLVVDHDHNTGAVRGLLCPDCNQALGLLRDSIVTLDAAKAYLQRSSAQTATPEPS